jgi:hypothetical protein
MLSEGLRIVGRQIYVDAGPLDLLGIDIHGRWTIVELKRDRLHRDALTQAIDYASSIASMPAGALRAKLEPFTAADPEVAGIVDQALDEEDGGPRQVAIVLAGVRADAHLERMTDFLVNQFSVPLSIVTFDVYRSDRETVLMREIVEEEAPTPDSTRQTLPLADITHRAEDAFRRIVAAADRAGLYVRPYRNSVMITPPTQRNRFLALAHISNSGRMKLIYGAEAFEEFFPEITSAEVTEIMGPYDDSLRTDETITEFVDRFEKLMATLPVA